MRNKKPSIRRVYSTPDDATDVSEFIQDLNLPEKEEEMEAIADTFWGVENLNGVFNWEGSDCQKSMRHHQKQWRHFKSLESHPKEEFVYQTKPDERDMESRSDNMDLSIEDMRVKRDEPKVNTFIGYIWRRWQQKAFHTTPVELTEFASERSKESKVYFCCSMTQLFVIKGYLLLRRTAAFISVHADVLESNSTFVKMHKLLVEARQRARVNQRPFVHHPLEA